MVAVCTAQERTAIAMVDGANGQEITSCLRLAHTQPSQGRIVSPAQQAAGRGKIRFGRSMTDQIKHGIH